MTVGTQASAADITFIGKTGGTRAGSAMTMSAPLNDVANAVDDELFRNYLVSYCSPSRAGRRDVKLEVTSRDAQGKASVGSYSTEIDADGFGPGCDPAAAPQFVVAKPKETTATTKAIASNSKPVSTKSKPATAAKEPKESKEPKEPSEKLSASGAAANANAQAAPIAEPPSGLGYE
jgi:hypothetical protein